MLAYAASRRTTAQRRPSPQAMLAIAVAHVAVIAAVMTAKMDLPEKLKPRPTEVDLIRLPPPPAPPEPKPRAEPRPAPSAIDTPPVIQPIPQPRVPVDTQPFPLTPGPRIGSPVPGPLPEPAIAPQPRPAAPVRTGPRFATPDHALRPPYPPSRIDSGEEASLRLRLTIDERGRVTSVEPVGEADRAFLAAARRHLIAKWRYRPATEDGRAVASSTVITLRFELE